MRLSERIADTIDDTDTALWIADEIWAMEDEIDDAREFNDKHPERSIASFACFYPNRYREAAAALRKVREDAK